MNNNLTFCENCRDDVSCVISDVELAGTLKGVKYSYMGKEARCANCGQLVYVPEIMDSNLEALQTVYRRENDIISLELIRAIPEKYAIGKRPLSLLLGWGEQTFSRYYDGDIPTKQYSEILQKIWSDPAYYAQILETKKESLTSLATYEKSRKAVDAVLNCSEQSGNGKIYHAVRYLLNQCEDITALALQKALYYIQGFFYAFYAEYLFTEDCEAWVHGPVYREVYQRYKDYRFDFITQAESISDIVLSAAEKSIFDSVINYFCCYSGKVLEHFTHNETPWLSTRGDLPLEMSSNRIIPRETIGSYFSEVKKKYHMVNPNDIRSYAADMFQGM